jgi:hypothetical protein
MQILHKEQLTQKELERKKVIFQESKMEKNIQLSTLIEYLKLNKTDWITFYNYYIQQRFAEVPEILQVTAHT